MRYLFKPRLKYIAEFILAGAIVVGLLILMDTQKGETQGGKEQAEGLIPAKLTLQQTHEFTVDLGGTTKRFKETVDATFLLEVPDIDYWKKWKKPYDPHTFDFTFPLSKPKRKDKPAGSRRKSPNARVVSYSGTVRQSYFYKHVAGNGCIHKTTKEGGGALEMEPGGSIGIFFKGDELADVSLITKEYTLTTLMEDGPGPGCKPGSGTLSDQHNFPAKFSMSFLSGLPQGWSGQLKRTPKGISGTAFFHKSIEGGEDRITVSFLLNLSGEEDMEAIHGPYLPIVRGDTLNLDGSRSKGKNLKYEWTFNPKGCPDGLKGNPNASKKGSKTTVRLLCDTDITLKVTDGKDTVEKTVSVVIQVRDWKTEVLPQIDAYLTAIKLCLPQPYFGRNVCALDGAAAFEGKQESNHIFHKEPNQITWEDTGYKLGRVNDSNGPFDGWWYVTKNHLKIQRAALINTYLNKDSELYEENKKKGYKKDFDTLIDQVTAHEQMHGTLMEEAIPKNDPAKKIEMMIHPKDKDALKLKIDLKIQDAEKALWEATKEDNVKERLKKMGFNHPGKVLLKLCNIDPPKYKVFSIPSFATLGD